MKPKVLIADKLSDAGIDILKKKCTVTVKTGMKESELVKEIPKFDAMVVRSGTKVTKKVIKAAKNLKIVARAGVGVDNIDIPAATEAGILVVNSPTGNILAAAELAVGHMFALARHIPQADSSMRQGRWDRKKYVGTQLAGKTLGIVGVGKIGKLVCRDALGIGMKVLVYDPVVSEDEASRFGATLVSMNELLKKADYITLHVPKSPRTHHLISTAQFGKMKKGVRIVNCSRGGVIDEEALLAAIEKGKVAGAALDVYETEPPGADNPLLENPSVVLTPHLGASTAEAQLNVATDVAGQVLEFFDGKFPSSAVNMPAISPEILETHQPYFELANKIGALHSAIMKGSISSVTIKYEGGISNMETDLVTRNFLIGLLKSRFDDINIVNAPVLFKERGVDITESSVDRRTRFTDLIIAEVQTGKTKHTVSGTLSVTGEPRIVSIDGYTFDLAPEGLCILSMHKDQPGVIGTVGTLLGSNDINIAGMQVGRETVRGQALMVINVDDEVPPELLKEIKKQKHINTVDLVSF